MSDPAPPNPQQPPVEIVVPEALIPGVYANGLLVWSTAHEFTFDFVSLQPGNAGAQQHVVARVKLPPGILYAVLQAITTHMTTYEQQHLPIPGAFGPTDMPPSEEPS
jgi:hypothetical protein